MPSCAAIVTGAGSGIGLAAVGRLREADWNIVALDKSIDAVSAGNGVVPMIGDVTDAAVAEEAVRRAVEKFGRLDALVLNAGVAVSGTIDEQSMDLFDLMMAVNVRGPALMIRAALPHLRRSGSPAIVVTGSISGLGGDADLWAYGASKAGVLNMVKSLSRALGPDNIRVNAVCPGIVATAINEETRTKRPDRAAALASAVPLRRWGQPEEVANVIRFLISAEAAYVNGAVIPVDGGLSTTSGMPDKARPAGG